MNKINMNSEKSIRGKHMEEQEDKSKAGRRQDKKEAAGRGLIARFAKLDIKKKIQYVGILLVIIVILAIYFASFSSTPAENPADDITTAPQYDDDIETRLKQTLSRISGAGEVEVMITYRSSGEIVPAISVDKQTSTTTDTDEGGSSTTNTENTQSEIVTVNTGDGNAALVLKEESPPIKGVIVVAEGADDIGVKIDLLSAVQTILNISPDQVDVYKMNIE